MTGISQFTTLLEAKRLELLHELLPNATVIAMLVNPTYSDVKTQLRGAQETARALGQEINVLKAASESDFDTAAFLLLCSCGRTHSSSPPTRSSSSRRHQLVAFDSSSGDTRNLSISGVRRGRRSDELRKPPYGGAPSSAMAAWPA